MSTTVDPTTPVTFSFGKNWEEYVAKRFTPERVRVAKEWLLKFLGVPDLKGKTFIDVGCGSGLSSLAAHDAGAERILSFDLDPASVETTRRLRVMRSDPAHWEVRSGSALDPEWLAGLGHWDVVYSWGVLHHTGRMWEAVRNVARLMKPDGVFYTALYTTDAASEFWTRIKLRYNGAGRLKKRLMEYAYVWHDLIKPNLLRPGRIRRRLREYQEKRGMDYMFDVRDWLGGYPYEHARVHEVLSFGCRELGLSLFNLKTGEACTEYLFGGPGCGRESLTSWQVAGAIQAN